jgi:hypothetical protein
LLVGIAYTLAPVGLRSAVSTDIGGDLANQLLVHTTQNDLGGGRSSAVTPARMLYRVREAQCQRNSIALDGGFVTYTNQLQLALEALGNTDYHVVDQCTVPA